MVVSGKFENYKNENLKEFLIALAKAAGNDGSRIEAGESEFNAHKSIIEITNSGDTYTVNATHLGKSFSNTFTIGQEFTDQLNKIQLNSIATLAGNKISLKSTRDGKPAGGRDYEVNGDELIVTLHAPAAGLTAKSYYKRV